MRARAGESGEVRTRRTTLALALGLVLGLLSPVLDVGTAPAAQAAPGEARNDFGADVYATSGSGLFTATGPGRANRIAWLSWGRGVGNGIGNGATVTNYHEAGPGESVEVTCSLSGLAAGGGLAVYQSGGYAGDGFDDLYGGANLRPGLISRKASGQSSRTQNFTVSCSARLVRAGGQVSPVSLGGLVVADAESMSASESLQATAVYSAPLPTASPWRVIDRHNGGCTAGNVATRVQGAVASVGNGWRLTVTNRDNECTTGIGTPNAVMLAEGASRIDFSLTDTGGNAVAIGYQLGVDLSDAPAPFGVAGGVVVPTWSGARVAGTTDIAGLECVRVWLFNTCSGLSSNNSYPTPSPALATIGPAATTIGATALANSSWSPTANATGDTPDEDAFPAGAAPAPAVYPGAATYSMTVPCRGTATSRVAGWIDWDRKDGFTPTTERSDVAVCASSTGGNVTLTWTVPTSAVDGPTFLRLRVSTLESDLTSPIGTSVAGEAEDWAITVSAARLEVVTTVTTPGGAPATEVPAAGGVVNYTVELRNAGNVPFTDAQRAYLVDDITGVLDDAALGDVASNPVGAVRQGNRITWSGPLAPGATLRLTYPVTVLPAPQDRIMTTVAVASTTAIAAEAAVSCERGSADLAAARCARSQLWAVGVDLVKQAYLRGTSTPVASGSMLAPNTRVEWRYTVTNTGSAPLTDVVLTDQWREQRQSGRGSGPATGSPVINCGTLPAATTVVIPRIEAGASVVCTSVGVVVPNP